MKEIDNDHGKRKSAFFVLADYPEKFVLGFIAELALPEPCRPVGSSVGKPVSSKYRRMIAAGVSPEMTK